MRMILTGISMILLAVLSGWLTKDITASSLFVIMGIGAIVKGAKDGDSSYYS